jgi:hypothetical protein
MSVLPALPSIHDAKLPQAYSHAKEALAACEKIDECKAWADKAAAMASYARQSEDTTLERLSMRIRARAIQRCGELLKEHDARGDHRKSTSGGTSSQRDIADQAGLSKKKQVTAVRVASIPTAEFEALVESDTPPTIKALANRGTAHKPRVLLDLGGRAPEDFEAATDFLGSIRMFLEHLPSIRVESAIRGCGPHEIARANSDIGGIGAWCRGALAQLEGRNGKG